MNAGSAPVVWTDRKFYLLLLAFVVVHAALAATLPVSG